MSSHKKLSTRQYLLYSLPHVSTIMIVTPLAVLQGIYAKYYGLSLTAIAGVVLLSRCFDAVIDPVVGAWADRYYRKRQTRKPFMIFGGLLLMVSAYFLFSPPATVTLTYFAVFFLLFYTGWTFLEIPYIAWGSDLAATSGEKATLYSWRFVASHVGMLCFFCLPLLPFFATTEFTPQILHWTAIIFMVIAAVSLFFCMTRIPEPVFPNRHIAAELVTEPAIPMRERLRGFLQPILANKPFCWFIGSYMAISMGAGMWYGMLFFYVDGFLQMGEVFAQLHIIAYVVAILVTPVWNKIIRVLGKKKSWSLGLLLMMLAAAFLSQLAPGSTTFAVLMSVKFLYSLGWVSVSITAPAILSEISDYGQLKFHKNYSATYFSTFSFCSKSVMAIGMSLGMMVAEWFGFDAAAASQSATATFGLRLAAAWAPLFFMLLAAVVIFWVPLDEKRHATIRRRLNHRTERANTLFKRDSAVAAEPITELVTEK